MSGIVTFMLAHGFGRRVTVRASHIVSVEEGGGSAPHPTIYYRCGGACRAVLVDATFEQVLSTWKAGLSDRGFSCME